MPMIVSTIAKVAKRDKTLVDFEVAKIMNAIRKAAEETGEFKQAEAEKLTYEVVKILEVKYADGAAPSVEHVQDIVELVLIKENWAKTAKSYILYRHEHAKRREQEAMENAKVKVTKRDGTLQAFDLNKLRKCIALAARGYEKDVDQELILAQVESDVYDGIKTTEIATALTYTARSFIERDPAYSNVAARLLAQKLYKHVIGESYDFSKLDFQYRQAFVDGIREGIRIGKLNGELADFDLERLRAALKPERDDLFEYLGMQTVYDRYLLRNAETKKIFETPQAFWMRVAMGLALAEKPEARTEQALRFYEVTSTLRFIPSTPTLFHAGTDHPQLSSCYLTTVTDSLDHIFKSIGDNAQLSKWSGGLGNDWTYLRATGALIKGTGVDSQGIVPFLKVANDTTAAINRSGKRRGATCAYLETWHYDIEDFLELRKNTGDERRRTHDMDTANWIPDLFMKRVKEDGYWTLFSPDEAKDLHDLYGAKFAERYVQYEGMAEAGKINLHRKVKARDLWKKMLSMLFETGHPWITFKDPCNVRSPQDHVGVVHSSNLCTEITLNTSVDEVAVCNLGSVNLEKHVINGSFDKNLVKDTVTTGMRMLDNVVDVNFYPIVEAKNSNMKHRPVGMGIMGFQDALYLLDIQFASDEAVKFADESMEIISYYAFLASSDLAGERGAYQSYRGSKWDRGLLPLDTLALLEQERGLPIDVARTMTMDWQVVRDAIKKNGMRNSNCLAIAPTATISNIAGSVPSIEPIYKNLYVKSNQSGDFVVINGYLVNDLKKLGLWDEMMIRKIKFYDGTIDQIAEIPEHIRQKYLETFDIDPKWLIKAAAYRGKWIDQSQSLNIFYRGTSGRDINDMYIYAWDMGIKTTYYLRTLGASQVEKSTVNTNEFGSTHIRSKSGANMPTVGPAETIIITNANPVTIDTTMIKACKIEDPTCEACQ